MSTTIHTKALLPPLFRFALSLYRDTHDAEELCRSAIERALTAKALPALFEPQLAYVIRIARNLHTDRLRRQHRRSAAGTAVAAADTGQPFAEHGVDLSERVWLQQAFEQLAPDAQEIIVLIDVIGLRYREAAWVLELPVGTVMSRIRRARAAMRDAPDATAAGAP